MQNIHHFNHLKTIISELFLVKTMPKEFYDLWSFCKKHYAAHPEGLLFFTLTLFI